MRLIDADAFKKQIAGITIANNYPANKASALCDLMDAQPTAYDVDKVVAELERLRDIERNRPDRCNGDGYGDPEDIYEDGVSQGRYGAYWKAIQIVKGGVIDGN